jgi:hypothetical protein
MSRTPLAAVSLRDPAGDDAVAALLRECLLTNTAARSAASFSSIPNISPNMKPLIRRDRQHYYGIPTEANARLWAKRTPSEFVFRAYRLFMRHQTPERGLAGSRYAGHNDEIAQ